MDSLPPFFPTIVIRRVKDLQSRSKVSGAGQEGNLLGPHRHRAARELRCVEGERRPRQLQIQSPQLGVLRLHRQRARDDTQPRLDQRLPSRAGAGSQEGDLLSGLEIPRTSPAHHDGRRRRFRQDNLGPVRQRSHHFEVQYEMLLELFPSAVIRRCSTRRVLIRGPLSNQTPCASEKEKGGREIQLKWESYILNCNRLHPIG